MSDLLTHGVSLILLEPNSPKLTHPSARLIAEYCESTGASGLLECTRTFSDQNAKAPPTTY